MNDHFNSEAGLAGATGADGTANVGNARFAPLEIIRVNGDVGKGRAFIVLVEKDSETQGEVLFRSMIDNSVKGAEPWKVLSSRVLLVVTSSIDASNFEMITQALLSVLAERSIRQASFVALGSAAAIVQAIALLELKLVRTLVLIDAATRPHPTLWERLLTYIEANLPLGLPFRNRSEGFFSTPFLQRIRCPVLILTTPTAPHFIQREALIFEERLPTAWRKPLSFKDNPSEIIINFQDVPAKCPQKGRK